MICTISECGRKAQARGLCNTHYWKWRKFGDPCYKGERTKASIARHTAKESGQTTYLTGATCKRGHIAPRRLSGQCVECKNFLARRNYLLNPIKTNASTKKWVEKNKSKMRDLVRDWERRNRPRKNEHRAARRALERNALPKWANRAIIASIYASARNSGLVVDHVVPLNNPNVCGLHVPANLQLITATANKAKHNRFVSEWVFSDGTTA